ncbi:MAG: NifB/NifX family molybdenum-iron cluster-binding protein [Candidatus Bathyarchaeota archaeon]|nr:NifB/NifX family molybdenum-iron cluster-binding protein [Candidatus Bathyarchaeum tardum]WGM88623.1 MAG: NifB/NifX family molybdenum-iron cluster-binding protein [Candidatus Bathyarchaeum tardum]WNZ29121.1 MAG: NifB/NifX family molybdenum-iron cluster-binding protein [Candidatus Bathyarchaeota archaeon]
MNTRLVIPVSEENGLDSMLSQHFGRAPFYAIIDLDENGKVIGNGTIANTSEHFGGVGLPPDRIMQLKPKALVTYGLGSKALQMFQAGGVAVLRTEANTVKDVVTAYNNDELQELTTGCSQSHNH